MLLNSDYLVTIPGTGDYPPLIALFGLWAICWLIGFGLGYVFSIVKTLFSSSI